MLLKMRALVPPSIENNDTQGYEAVSVKLAADYMMTEKKTVEQNILFNHSKESDMELVIKCKFS